MNITEKDKALVFEYIVYKLNDLKNEFQIKYDSIFTKLRLQKLLFLISTINATSDNKGLLDIFNNFYALSYGPVEKDIYDLMNNGVFENIKFNGNKCDLSKLNENTFNSLDNHYTDLVNASIEKLKAKGVIKEYLEMPVFDLVNITHQWTVWKVAMYVANMLNSGGELMSTDDIINSSVKAY